MMCEDNDWAYEDMADKDFLSAEEWHTCWYSTEVDEETGEEIYVYYGFPAH
jgi:hypothetical protein